MGRGPTRKPWEQCKNETTDLIRRVTADQDSAETLSERTKLRNKKSAASNRLKNRQKEYFDYFFEKARERVTFDIVIHDKELTDVVPVVEQMRQKMQQYRYDKDKLGPLMDFKYDYDYCGLTKAQVLKKIWNMPESLINLYGGN